MDPFSRRTLWDFLKLRRTSAFFFGVSFRLGMICGTLWVLVGLSVGALRSRAGDAPHYTLYGWSWSFRWSGGYHASRRHGLKHRAQIPTFSLGTSEEKTCVQPTARCSTSLWYWRLSEAKIWMWLCLNHCNLGFFSVTCVILGCPRGSRAMWAMWLFWVDMF